MGLRSGLYANLGIAIDSIPPPNVLDSEVATCCNLTAVSARRPPRELRPSEASTLIRIFDNAVRAVCPIRQSRVPRLKMPTAKLQHSVPFVLAAMMLNLKTNRHTNRQQHL